MIFAANLGFPRLGAQRELKRSLERYWLGKIDAGALLDTGRGLRRAHWELQRAAGIDIIPSNDFSLYDHVLDTAAMVGAVPQRYQWQGGNVDLQTYFAMARGGAVIGGEQGASVTAMEMTKWFDTNYHYIVPEFHAQQQFHLASTKAIDEFAEAKALGIQTRPVLLGPVSFLALGKSYSEHLDRFSLLPGLLPVYAEVLKRLAATGATSVQIDEPILALDLSDQVRSLYQQAYAVLAQASPVPILLATYFGDLRENLDLALRLPVAGLHVDLVRGPAQLGKLLAQGPADKTFSLGLISGENIWRTDLDGALATLHRLLEVFSPERLEIAPSTSLIYCPHDLALEDHLDEELKSWLAFSKQKLAELVVLRRAVNEGESSVAEELATARRALASRRASPRTWNAQVQQQRSKGANQAMAKRQSPFAERRIQQQAKLNLPLLPTTTIGSFPQTEAVRSARLAYLRGDLDDNAYRGFLEDQIRRSIRIQEEIGLDVLVHGEFERTDMVEFFGQHLSGFAFTAHGWVQSYGSRAVRPPILYGDVARREPMTIAWAVFAQSLTDLPVKGMLTGPVTILNWSFVRDDQPAAASCRQIALALREEVLDLEAAGIGVIQIDEPALREGLPLRKADWDDYLAWSVECFRLAAAGVRDDTQIHTHVLRRI